MTVAGCKSSRTRTASGYSAASGSAVDRNTSEVVESALGWIRPACGIAAFVSAIVTSSAERVCPAHLLSIDEDAARRRHLPTRTIVNLNSLGHPLARLTNEEHHPASLLKSFTRARERDRRVRVRAPPPLRSGDAARRLLVFVVALAF